MKVIKIANTNFEISKFIFGTGRIDNILSIKKNKCVE